jgi:REP element-mobilizing transposase RayT
MIRLLDRHWLLTSTTYGTWLPGDRRGFVSPVREEGGDLVLHNIPGTPYDSDVSPLEHHAREQLKGPKVLLSSAQADAVCAQFVETALHRGWLLLAASVMANHVHLVVSVTGDPDPSKLLGDFKSYGSRALNREWKRPASETWWTTSGSKRKLPSEEAVRASVAYVVDQKFRLALYVPPEVPRDWYPGEPGT